MENVPQIVRERLRVAPMVASHPDANMLTAFAERSLTESERMEVLNHISRCGDCRDVVTLALPETESAVSHSAVARRPWMAWPALRWGTVAAGIVLIASIGILQYSRRHEVSSIGKFLPTQPAVLDARMQATPASEQRQVSGLDKDASETRLNSASSSATVDQSSSEKKLDIGASAARGVRTGSNKLPARSKGLIGAAPAGPVAHGLKMPAQWQQQNRNTLKQTVPAAPATANEEPAASVDSNIPPASQTVEVTTQAAQEAGQYDQLERDQNAKREEPSSLRDDESSRVAKAKAPEQAEVATSASPDSARGNSAPPQELPAQSGNTGTSGRNYSLMVNLKPALTARWTVTGTGNLQRSFDQGATWQNVDVTAENSISSTTSTEVSSVSRRRKRSSEKKSDQKTTGPPVFRAVAATGTDVWAGGSSGVLYHSVDAGDRWSRVAPVSGGILLTSDVVAVEFSDAQHGKIKTSTAEVWTTSDNGQTWQKQ